MIMPRHLATETITDTAALNVPSTDRVWLGQFVGLGLPQSPGVAASTVPSWDKAPE